MKFLILICVIIIVSGLFSWSCSASENGAVKPGEVQGFDSGKLQKLSTNPEGSPGQEMTGEIEQFRSFSQDLFSIWALHIDKTSDVLESFNQNDIPVQKKMEYAIVLEKQYQDFEEDIRILEPPAIAETAHKKAMEAVSCRVLFFKSFIRGTNINELNEIENRAYILEAQFWEEMDRIYEYFEERVEKETRKKYI
jgi:hypothetical protein